MGETLSERKHWKAEEKLAIINEIKDKGHVVEICREYGADPTMFYHWKELEVALLQDAYKKTRRRNH